MSLIKEIASNVARGNYGYVDAIITSNINNKELLYYSLLLYEQKGGVTDEVKNQHVTFWNNSQAVRESWKKYKSQCIENKLYHYPVSISITCTTYCNLHCKNCTHDNLIQEKKITESMAEYEEIKYRIRKIKLLTLFNSVKDSEIIELSMVGLGEPLTYPHLFDVYHYCRTFFPKARLVLNTNATLLTDERCRMLLDSSIDQIIFSLSYFDKDIYYQEIRVDTNELVKKNIVHFLKMYYEEHSKKRIVIHIFDNKLNTKEHRTEFENYFRQYVGSKVQIDYRPFGTYTDMKAFSIEREERIKKAVCGCATMWRYLTLDVEGKAFPCCLALWKMEGYDESYIKIGDSNDTVYDINKKVKELRIKQINGDYGCCRYCEELYQVNSKRYLDRLRKKYRQNKGKMAERSLQEKGVKYYYKFYKAQLYEMKKLYLKRVIKKSR